LDLFGIPALLERLEGDPEISKSDCLCVRRALGAAVDAYLRSLTPDERRSDTVHAADYETHRGRTMDAIETFPLTFGSKCYNIFQDLDRVLEEEAHSDRLRPSDTTTRPTRIRVGQPRLKSYAGGEPGRSSCRRCPTATVPKMADGGRPSQ
jgi:hypothetical protein